jgi:hypothetical protein
MLHCGIVRAGTDAGDRYRSETMLHSLLVLLAVAAAPGDFVRDEQSGSLDFHYEWPAAVNAVPRLRAALQADMAHDHRLALSYVADSRRLARQNHIDFQPHDYSKSWTIAGTSARLISLTADLGAFTGGAHPNSAYFGLTWDRASDRAVPVATLLGPALLRRLRARFCAALNAQRAENRGEPVRPDPADPFTTCPAFAELVLAPADGNHNGRFERLDVLIAPYLAGAYVEGSYEVEVRLDAGDVAAVPAVWRASFEAARR